MNLLTGRYPLAVAIGAIFGALSRFYGTELAKAIFGKDFGFYGTFTINVTGCLIIAYILTLATENLRIISPELRLMTTTGFCGAYTTFSTYGLESKGFLDKGDITTLLIYFVGSAIAGMIGIQIGVLLARASAQSS
ncbi:fluoride efflux transporter CrcB [Nostoc punctiforme]|jgi:CrcB protein|uniref:Fluoride-specific ion channel FluC n=1 Tax=Nostoc punctiforme (strain ATCC 29133 / PCC 73102) TaxID=63737 RepID=B2J4R5_NOSP7|nr:fluoride efflux transporter CrcB [Nostoc punctiforme]ACC79037.1 CrcB protein [Nostoc punctiforme PCC 73102]